MPEIGLRAFGVYRPMFELEVLQDGMDPRQRLYEKRTCGHHDLIHITAGGAEQPRELLAQVASHFGEGAGAQVPLQTTDVIHKLVQGPVAYLVRVAQAERGID